jgi:hypothetical protein
MEFNGGLPSAKINLGMNAQYFSVYTEKYCGFLMDEYFKLKNRNKKHTKNSVFFHTQKNAYK